MFRAWPVIPALALLISVQFAAAQDNYEIQVYESPTVDPGVTMIESHSNFTFKGSAESIDGTYPTQDAFHETIEITRGITAWSEVGFYIFTSARSGNGIHWVGDHIRPRIRAPESWSWPVGVSLSAEVGYQERTFSVDTWTAEIRPIIDWERAGFYLSLNPVMDISLHGENQGTGWDFSPCVKASCDITPVITAGLEYYGSFGPVTSFSPADEQQHQLFPSLDLNFSPEWEFNCGLGFGLTPSTDRIIFKMILGKRIGA